MGESDLRLPITLCGGNVDSDGFAKVLPIARRIQKRLAEDLTNHTRGLYSRQSKIESLRTHCQSFMVQAKLMQ